MLIVLVHVHVKPNCVEAFREASLENARNSIQEAGIARFDVLQDNEEPTRFILNEVYRDNAAPAAHEPASAPLIHAVAAGSSGGGGGGGGGAGAEPHVSSQQ